ncbi:exodeoxyribonuclease I [Psychrobium sp. nBUS_13]|uniref:exodeoxyribonuclease I n=1 Tax=Psychrobium sp. nBUS_13 TaxID=3395319 RepID=UPI003EB70960
MTNLSQPTILWHDYETWGADTRRDRPAQFAAIRTDLDLNIIGDPIELYCELANDYLPAPQACFVTGLTPQKVNRLGMPETQFIEKINNIFSQPNTTVAGYNNIRFDDEITRQTLYRNFQDPYAREWQNGCSRWDIIDLVRTCYALRPDGITWPTNDEGVVSFRLELLTAANNISHEGAHDAISDVIATIEMAKLIKTKQPKLFDYVFNLRRKAQVSKQFDLVNFTPLVHISSKIPATSGCSTYIAPIAYHPVNKNAMVCVNLNMDLSPLLELTAQEINERMYTKRSDLGHLLPIALKLIHINKCPVIAPAKTLTKEAADQHGIDRGLCRKNLDLLIANPQLRETVTNVYQIQNEHPEETNPDLMLYSGGFFSHHDKNAMERLLQTPPEQLPAIDFNFEDKRLNEMLFRYRARNFPLTLSQSEQQRWNDYRMNTMDGQGYAYQLETLALEHGSDERKMAILKALFEYASSL